MPQLVTRLDAALVAEVDDLLAAGVVSSRSEAVRQGLALLVERHRRTAVGTAIVDAYRRQPQTGPEVGWADAASTQMIADEPW